MGRRSSHTPYLDEGENTQAFLSVLLEPGMNAKGKNRSAEQLGGERSRSGNSMNSSGNMANFSLFGPNTQSEDLWQMGARSTGALNEQGVFPWQTQFEALDKERRMLTTEKSGKANKKETHDSGRRKHGRDEKANYLQQMADYQQQQARLVTAGFISATVVEQQRQQKTVGSGASNKSSIGSYQGSAFESIRKLKCY